MKQQGIHLGKDLKAFSKVQLINRFGKMGNYYYDIAQGLDDRPVQPERERKSYSTERTFESDLQSMEEIDQKVSEISGMVATGMQKRNFRGKTIFIKIRYSDFSTFTRQRTLSSHTNDRLVIEQTAKQLIHDFMKTFRPVRLLGVGLANLDEHQESQITMDFN